MGFNVEEAKANYAFGGARANKFNVIVNNRVDSSGDVKFNFSCKGSSLPGVQMGKAPIFYKGREIPLIGDRPPFLDWTVRVYNDEDFLIWNAFMRWNSALNAHQGNIMNGIVNPNPYSYRSDAVVTHESMGGPVPIKRVKVVGIWPVEVGQVELDWETVNQVEVFDVTFSVDYWVSEGVTDGF